MRISADSVEAVLAARPQGETADRPSAPPETEAARASAVNAPATTKVVIELDHAAARFVQKLFDASNEAVLRQYPNDTQLAFSRGVTAYLEALARR